MKEQNTHEKAMKISRMERLVPNRNLMTGIVFLVGVVIGMLIAVLAESFYSTEKVDYDFLQGSMYNFNTPNTTNLDVDVENVKVDISAGFLEENFLQTIVEVKSGEDINLKFEFNPGDFSVALLKPITYGQGSNISGGSGFVNIANKGSNKYVFLLKGHNRLSDQIDVKIYQDGRIIYGNTLLVSN